VAHVHHCSLTCTSPSTPSPRGTSTGRYSTSCLHVFLSQLHRLKKTLDSSLGLLAAPVLLARLALSRYGTSMGCHSSLCWDGHWTSTDVSQTGYSTLEHPSSAYIPDTWIKPCLLCEKRILRVLAGTFVVYCKLFEAFQRNVCLRLRR
jgi:hypothetical protein